MVGELLLRGMIAGLIAGLLAFGAARVFGEPQVERAIAFEEQLAQAKGEAPEPELVSRTTQAGLGLFTGMVVFSAALGGLFALAFAFAHGRLGPFGPRSTSALLALGGFVAITLVPALKYPANPPSVGIGETIGYRTELFFVMLIISVCALVAAVALARRLARSASAWTAGSWAALLFVVLIAVVYMALPDINEVPEQFSATLLWQFRVTALGLQLLLWATLGLLFGLLAERCLAQPVAAARLRVRAPSA